MPADLPNADRASVDPRKVRDYLLSFGHREGKYKAVFFFNLGYTHARRKLEAWRLDYNTQRLHSSLSDRTPPEFTRQWQPEAEGCRILNL